MSRSARSYCLPGSELTGTRTEILGHQQAISAIDLELGSARERRDPEWFNLFSALRADTPRAIVGRYYGGHCRPALDVPRDTPWPDAGPAGKLMDELLSRDRICRVADWAWDLVWEHCRRVFPTARLWPTEWNRWTVSDWHRETVGWNEENKRGLNLPARYPLHCARDHWAVRAARAGTPVAVIQAQLGHGSPMLTLTKYGRFLPSSADRAKWEMEATKHEAARRQSATS